MDMRWFPVGAALLLTTAPAAAGAPDLPRGWRRPTDAALQGPDLALRQRDPGRNLRVAADFDGDGDVDRAELLLSDDGRRYGLFVVRTGSPGDEVQKLAEGPASALARTGVRLTAPGEYPTACAKGAGAGPCETKTVRLAHPGVSLFTFESAASHFYWDGGRFARAWTSD